MPIAIHHLDQRLGVVAYEQHIVHEFEGDQNTYGLLAIAR
jgi:hypothetical protein